MGTRSIIAAEFPDGSVKGVYKHWDGYPSSTLADLQALIARDGREKVVKTILGKPYGWSVLRIGEEGSGVSQDKRFRTVKGYGEQYTRTPAVLPNGEPWKDGNGKVYKQGNSEYRTETDAEEYFYVIRLDGVVVWTVGAGDHGPWYSQVPDEDDNAGIGYPHWRQVPGPSTINEDTMIRIAEGVLSALDNVGVKFSEVEHLFPGPIAETVKQISS